MSSISWAITCNNEHVELERLLDQLNSFIKPIDEIIIQMDTTATPEVKKVVEKYNIGTKYDYHRIIYGLNKDFAAFKNNLKQHCTRDWIINLDADEYLSDGLIENIHGILNTNKGLVDVITIPRINTVIGIGLYHVKEKWRWFSSKIENPEFIKEKVLDLDNPQDKDQYDLLKEGGFIIEEIPSD